ncbi:MAG: glycine cleavage system aminomethyltransferase GcvT [Caldicoprobacterales bacterium]|nr:glycine cleavage system aminomethyltransferase GcvT [Clostridiales bacterium]
MKKTPLYETHTALGGKIINFGGWALPVQYSSILKEHHAVRNAAGLFDVSHMGEILIEGKDAQEYLQHMITNDISKMSQGRAVYSPMCYRNGGTVDDLLIYKLEENKYLLVVNASNTEKDYEWLMENCTSDDLLIKDVSSDYGLIAIQGPASQKILQKLTSTPLDEIRFFRFADNVEVGGVKAIVSRTGYTGEDGFELYVPSYQTVNLWDRIMEAGAGEGLVPAGLGARDTLRFEVALPLYGQELSPNISPLEAGLGRFVKLNKQDFIGKDALLRQAEEGLKRKLAGFEMVDKGMPRTGYKVLADEKEIGFVTSGGLAPTLKKNLGLALVNVQHSNLGDEFYVQVRGKSLKAKVVSTPFYAK